MQVRVTAWRYVMTDIALVLKQLIPSIDSVQSARSIGGGCISEASRVEVRDSAGQASTVFAKTNVEDFLDNFQAEWDGLTRLHEAGAVRVPKPLALGVVDDQAWLITEWIHSGERGSRFFEDFGGRLANLHRATLGDRIGLDQDNYLGAARQINQPVETWESFFATHRIGFQIGWAIDQGVDGRLRSDCEQIVRHMDSLLSGRATETALLHGDLWSGNYLCSDQGEPVLIDPAVYYGCREAEFGMLNLFGACPPSFYEAYQDAFPMKDGWQRRVQVYVLYHLLNHLNLFGGGYLGQCQTLAAEILRA